MKKDLQPNLTKEKIVNEAIALVNKKGMPSLSMRMLGARLSVEGMALYYHFPNKQALIEAMLDRVHAEISIPEADIAWQDFVRQRSASVIEVLRRHPWAATLMESGVRPGEYTMQDRERLLAVFRQAGFSVSNAVHAITIVDVFTYGFVTQLVNLSFSTKEDAAVVGQDVIAMFAPDKYPYMREMVSEHMLKRGYDVMDEFVFGLELIITGLERFEGESNNKIETH